MSTPTMDDVYGYGFAVYVSDADLADFIKKHASTVEKSCAGREILSWIQEKEDQNEPFDELKEKFFDFCDTNDCGIYGIISYVMRCETELGFEYIVTDDEQDDVIIFPEKAPWRYTEKEKTLSLSELKNICEKYIKELGGQLVFGRIQVAW